MNVRRARRGARRLGFKLLQDFQQLPPPCGAEPPLQVQHVDEGELDRMRPGDLFLLSEAESASSGVAPAFLAVLACPACGALFLLTAAQYFGATPVICQSKLCSCRFRIVDGLRLVYLPVN
jgi:hypothetical protein